MRFFPPVVHEMDAGYQTRPRKKSAEFMLVYLALFSFMMSLLWVLYGILGRDPFLMVITEQI
jgi:hypothetical protein